MCFRGRNNYTRVVAAATMVLCFALTLGGARAQDKTYTMKISIATINDQIHAFAKNFGAAIEKDSGGRIKAEIYPASQLGSIPRQTEGVQFGAIQCQVVPPDFLVGVDERFEVMATPGLVESMAQASGWLLIARTRFEKMPFRAALKEVKLRSFVTPGQVLEVSAKIVHEGSGFARTEAQVRADGKVMCDADITFRVVDFPKGEFLASMHEVARRIELPIEAVAHG